MIRIIHLDNSRSERIVWLMEELGQPYELVHHDRDQGMAPSTLKRIHPLGKAPLVIDGDRVLMESGAIVEYILARYGAGRLVPPQDGAAYTRYLEWMHFAEGSMMSALGAEFLLRISVTEDPEEAFAVQFTRQRRLDMLGYMEHELAHAPYLAGAEFTAADLMMEFCFSFLERYTQHRIDRFPKIGAWLQRIRERPAYQRMLQKAGPKAQGWDNPNAG